MNPVLALALIAASAAVAVETLLLVRRRSPAGGWFADSDRAAGIFGVLGTAFAVLLAFVIFLALEGYGDARRAAGQEAVAATQMYRTTGLMRDPLAGSLRGELVCYARSVVADEWPTMRDGRSSARVQGWLDAMGESLARDEPRTAREAVALEQWLAQDSDRRDGRRQRLAAADSFVPPLMWIVLVLGTVLVIGYMLLFADPAERAPVQALMIGGVTALVVSSLVVIAALDDPYHGSVGSIRPAEMERTLDLIAGTRSASLPPPAPPCDAAGVRPA